MGSIRDTSRIIFRTNRVKFHSIIRFQKFLNAIHPRIFYKYDRETKHLFIYIYVSPLERLRPRTFQIRFSLLNRVKSIKRSRDFVVVDTVVGVTIPSSYLVVVMDQNPN